MPHEFNDLGDRDDSENDQGFQIFRIFPNFRTILLTHSYEFSMFYGFQDQNILVQNSTNEKPDEGET